MMRVCFTLLLGLFIGTAISAAGCSQPQSNGGASGEGGDRPTGVRTIAWDQLRVGITADEVLRLLGKPKDVEVEMVSTFWFYSDLGNEGPRIIFDTRHMTVNRWVRP